MLFNYIVIILITRPYGLHRPCLPGPKVPIWSSNIVCTCKSPMMAYTWRGCFRRRSPNMEKIPPLRTRGIIDLPTCGMVIMVWWLVCSTVSRQVGGSNGPYVRVLWLSPQAAVHDWVNKGLGMSSRICETGYINDPVSLIEKSRASCPGGTSPPNFIHQVIIVTGLNKLYDCMFSP